MLVDDADAQTRVRNDDAYSEAIAAVKAMLETRRRSLCRCAALLARTARIAGSDAGDGTGGVTAGNLVVAGSDDCAHL